MLDRFDCPVCGADAWRRTAWHDYAPSDAAGLSSYVALRRRVLYEVWAPDGDEPRRLAAVVCSECGYGSAAPRPDAADVKAKYEFLLRAEDAPGASASDHAGQVGDEQRAQRTADMLLPHVPPDTRTVIDVGGGDGKLLGPFRAAGMAAYLVDYNPTPRPGVERLGNSIEDLTDDHRFGAAILSHVLEHATDPVELLAGVRRHLVPDGALYLEVPSEHWGGLPIAADPVTHVGFFTPATLRLAAERAGFDVVSSQEGSGSYAGSAKGVIVLVGRVAEANPAATAPPGAGHEAITRATPSRKAALAKSRLARRRPPVRTLVFGSRRRTPPLVVMTDVYPKLSETFIIGEIRALERLGQTVIVEAVAPADERFPLRADDPVANFLTGDSRKARLSALAWLLARHPVASALDLVARRRWRAEERTLPLRVLAPVVRRIRRSGAKRVHVHFASQASLVALRSCRILGIPWSLTAHAYDIFLYPTNLQEKLLAAEFVTTGCEYNVRYLRALLPPEEATKVHSMIMGVRPADFTRTRPHASGRRVVAVGRLVEKKGFRFLVEAAAVLRERGEPIEVVIVGDGALRDALEQQAAQLGVEADVRFAGSLAPEAVRRELEDADLLACPCVVAADGDRDSMPVVVKEAMAMELPVVGSDEVGLPEMIAPERGRLVPPSDPAALAEAIAEVLALPLGERAAMGSAGRAWVEEFANVDVETKRLFSLLEGRNSA